MAPTAPRLQLAWDVALAGLTVGNLAWTTWCLGGYRPETFAISAPLLLVTLALAWTRAAILRGPGAWCPRLAWWPLPFLAYALLNVVLHSPVPWLGWLDWFLWLHLAAAFWLGLDLLRRPAPRRIIWTGVVVVAIGAVGLAVYQRLSDPAWLPMGRTQAAQYLTRSGGPFGIPNSLAALLLLLIPPTVALLVTRTLSRSARLVAGGCLLVFLVGLLLTISRGAWLSLALAAIAAPLLVQGRPWRRRLALAGAGAVLAMSVAGLLYVAAPRVQERIDHFIADRGEPTRPIMWGISWRLFQDEPLWGTGAGSYRVLLERYRPEGFRDAPKWTHNDYLNTLSDYGAVGFVLSFGVAAFAAWRLPRPAAGERDRSLLLLGLDLGLFAFGLSMLFDFHLKIPALVMVFGLYLAERVLRTTSGGASALPTSGSWRIAAGVAAAGLVVSAIALALPRLGAEALRYAARQKVDSLAGVTEPARLRAEIEPAVKALRLAAERDPAHAQAWSDLSLATSQRGHYAPIETPVLAQEAEAAARRALAITEVVPEFWVHLGIALDLQGNWVEAGRCFSRALELAPNHQLMWYYQAHHYSLKPATLPLAWAAIATCLRLDPGNPAAEALRERLRPNR
jgi:O-antigen ligase